ncbi:hypothetical protein Bca52824_000053 [Brassica carinata]|uniref:Uncharacterized protein n=1 Tax=Brassica carinata TaxID=52824 RepID=A0A8X7WIG7_BRACI|nr:hypothetical protein Bca52824_000053 [Brassica carinata]
MRHTTYEYVVAMRAMSEVPSGASVDEEMPNVLYILSLDLQQQALVVEAPLVYHTKEPVSSVSADANAAVLSKDIRNSEPRLPLSRNSSAPSHGSKDEYETETHSMSSFSSPSHVHEAVMLSPLPQYHTAGHRFAAGASSNAPRPPLNPATRHMIHSTFDEKIMQKGNKAHPLLHPAASLLRDMKRTSVVWDQEAGRYVSVPAATSEAINRLTSHHQPIPSSHTQNKRSVLPPQDSSSGKAPPPPPPQQGERLMYTGDSIFFGGPLLDSEETQPQTKVPVFAPVGNRK